MNPRVSEMLYRAVVQAVLLFGAESCVFSAEIYWNLEGVHVGFLRQMTGHKAKRQRERTSRRKAAAKVLKESGTQKLGAYIDKRQAKLAQ